MKKWPKQMNVRDLIYELLQYDMNKHVNIFLEDKNISCDLVVEELDTDTTTVWITGS
jgi:hypothetical protein